MYNSMKKLSIRKVLGWCLVPFPCLFLSFIFRLIFGRRQLLGVGQVVDGDGQEDVEQGVVAEQGQDDEVEGVDHSGSVPALGLDALVHDLVPVLAGQHLGRI